MPKDNIDLRHVRKEYFDKNLQEKDLSSDPFVEFQKWLHVAQQVEVPELNAASLSTVNASGQPRSRIILIKEISVEGFVFFTNYESDKGVELASNSKAALLFWWQSLVQEIRIEGEVSKISPAHSDEYFALRPFAYQIGALTSSQSRPIQHRVDLEQRYQQLLTEHQNQEVKRPDYWGGYILKPQYYEFWQGRESRLHDRYCYRLVQNNWKISFLAP